MQLGRHQLHPTTHPSISSIDFAHGDDAGLFSLTYEGGYAVWKTHPVRCLRKRETKGTLERVLVLPEAPLLALQGGGRSPLYPPNKVVIRHDALGEPLAELEFGEKVAGLQSRPGALVVVLPHATLWYDYGIDKEGDDVDGTFWIERRMTWQTERNPRGLCAMSVQGSNTTLALPGRQAGHCQLIAVVSRPDDRAERHCSIPARPAASALRVPILIAHAHPLAALALDAQAEHLITASERGTLLRLWDVRQGRLLRELRRGADQADIWGVSFRGPREDGRGDQVVAWSDKGTVHVWPVKAQARSRREESERRGSQASLVKKGGKAVAKLVKANVPLPNYFSAEASHQQFTLPTAAQRSSPDAPAARDDLWHERFTIAWLRPASVPYVTTQRDEGSEMVLITHSGGWYRLLVPHVDGDTVQDMTDTACKVVEHRDLWRLAEG